LSAHIRPTKSVPLPGAKGTTRWIGLLGNLRFENSAAFAVEGAVAAASPSARKSRRLIVDLSTSSPLLPAVIARSRKHVRCQSHKSEKPRRIVDQHTVPGLPVGDVAFEQRQAAKLVLDAVFGMAVLVRTQEPMHMRPVGAP